MFLGQNKNYHGPQSNGIRVKHKGARFHRSRDFKQYYFSSIPPTSQPRRTSRSRRMTSRGSARRGPDESPAARGRRAKRFSRTPAARGAPARNVVSASDSVRPCVLLCCSTVHHSSRYKTFYDVVPCHATPRIATRCHLVRNLSCGLSGATHFSRDVCKRV